MDNFFILLELPFDPPEGNTDRINEAIVKKQRQWSDMASHPVHGPKARGYLAQIEEIKKVMLHAESRKEEAAKAKIIKEEKRKELEGKLLIYRSKGSFQEKDLARLVTVYGPYGFSESEIKNMYGAEEKKEEAIDPAQVLDKSRQTNLRNFMKALNLNDKTLYDFLGMKPTASCSQLIEAADAMKKKILAKGTQTGEDEATKNLCGLCATIFRDNGEKLKYDNYLKLTKYSAVNDTVDEFARANQKRIEPKMKESLIDIAVTRYHVSVSDASVYINHYCEYMGYTLPENKIICGLCQAENPAGTTNCVKCGKPLVITCPSCKAANNNSAKQCAKCGFDLTKMDQAIALLLEAKKKHADKDLNGAEKLVKEAKAYWPNHEDILALEKIIDEERKRGSDIIAAITKDIQDKRMYAAQTKIDQAKAGGFMVDPAVSSKVAAAIQETEMKLAKMRNASGDAAFDIARQLMDIIADSDELNRSIKKFPPAEASMVQGKRVGETMTLSWKASPSTGDVSYQVVRKENTHPNDPTDGITVYQGKELSYTDNSIPKNKVFYYGVFAVRLGVYSRSTKLDGGVSVVDKVTKLKAIGGDGMITLSWVKGPSVTEIRVYRYRGVDRPQNDDAYELIPCSRLDGMLINGLTNGTNYWFAVSAGQTINGTTYYSEKVYISAIPQKPALPLENFTVHFTDDVFQASWAKSEWDVILLYAKQKPDYAPGIIYDLDELLQKYEKIDINLKSLTDADFKLNFVGECYIIPGVISASNVILNTAAYISSVPSAKNVTSDVNAAGTEMYVNFTWPKKIDRSVLVYRMDAFPTGIDDPLAFRVECSKKQYEANEGILLLNPLQGTYYAHVYTYFETGDHRVYSEPCQGLLSNEPQRDVYYSFRYKKGGLFSKKCTLTVEIQTQGTCAFPAFAVVSKFKGVPLKRGDGDMVCTVTESTEIKNTHTFEFDVAPMRSETRLKLFFLNDKHYKAFRITCKAGNII